MAYGRAYIYLHTKRKEPLPGGNKEQKKCLTHTKMSNKIKTLIARAIKIW
jgi:hypothetical protein